MSENTRCPLLVVRSQSCDPYSQALWYTTDISYQTFQFSPTADVYIVVHQRVWVYLVILQVYTCTCSMYRNTHFLLHRLSHTCTCICMYQCRTTYTELRARHRGYNQLYKPLRTSESTKQASGQFICGFSKKPYNGTS